MVRFKAFKELSRSLVSFLRGVIDDFGELIIKGLKSLKRVQKRNTSPRYISVRIVI